MKVRTEKEKDAPGDLCVGADKATAMESGSRVLTQTAGGRRVLGKVEPSETVKTRGSVEGWGEGEGGVSLWGNMGTRREDES